MSTSRNRTSKSAPTLSAQSRKQVMQDRRRLMTQQRKEKNRRRKAISEQFRTWDRRSYHRQNTARYNSLITAYANVLRIVGSSWDLDNFVKLDVSEEGWSAATDFRNVYITAPRLEEQGDGTLVYLDGKTKTDLDTVLRTFLTLGYHEIGHCLFSLPFSDLNQLLTDEEDAASGNAYFPTLLTDRYTKLAWNMLEDQRMENAMIHESPDLTRYFRYGTMEAMKSGTDWTLYLLLIGRWWLPDSYRARAKVAFKDGIKRHAGVVFDNPDETTLKAERIVYRYVKATKAKVMVECINDMKKLLESCNVQNLPKGLDDHSESSITYDEFSYDEVEGAGDSVEKEMEEEAQERKKKVEKTGRSNQQTLKKEDTEGEGEEEGTPEQGTGDIEAPEEEGDDTDGESSGEDSVSSPSSDNQGEFGEGAGAGEEPTEDLHMDEWTDEQHLQADEEIQRTMAEDQDYIGEHMKPVMHEFTRSYNDTEESDFRGSTVASSMPPKVIAYSQGLADSLARSFESSVANNSPSWRQRTSSGILNPFQYRNRNKGDRDFYRFRSADEDIGSDIAVTLVLDNSGSMDNSTGALSIMAYSVALACEMIGAQSRILLFNSGTYLYKGWTQDPYPGQITATGGTDPSGALKVLGEPAPSATHHLALVMTDGQFWLDDSDTVFGYGETHVIGYVYEPTGWRFSKTTDQTARNAYAKSQFEEINIYEARYITSLPEMVNDIEAYVLANLF